MPSDIVSSALMYAHAYRGLHQHLSLVLTPFRLTLLEWSFLTIIAEHPSLTMRQYAVLMSFDAPQITQLAQVLDERGLITITTGSSDKRIRLLDLSTKGQQQITLANQEITWQAGAVFEGLTPDEIQTNLKVLKHVIANTSV